MKNFVIERNLPYSDSEIESVTEDGWEKEETKNLKITVEAI